MKNCDVCVCVCDCVWLCKEDRGQLTEASSLLLSCDPRESISGHQLGDRCRYLLPLPSSSLCTHVLCAHICKHSWSCSAPFILMPLRPGLSANVELGWQPASPSTCLCLPSTGLQCALDWFMWGFCRFELRSSCLGRKHSSPLSHLSSLAACLKKA